MAAETSAAQQEALPSGVLRCFWLGPEREDNVLKAGLTAISDALGTQGLLTFPRRPNGSPVLTRQGFFERLLRREILLQDCSNTDVNAAEGDVKHLSLEQLLAIRCQNFEFNKKGAAEHKERFLKLVDRAAMELLSVRLLREEPLSDVHRALLMRHVVLIYGANQELRGMVSTDGGAGNDSEWWLLAIGGSRYHLHLPRCEVKASAPSSPVWCFRSHTAPDPRDPSRSRSFKWQALLVSNTELWLEDPLSTEQRIRTRRSSTLAGKGPQALGLGEKAWQKATAETTNKSKQEQQQHEQQQGGDGSALQANGDESHGIMELFGDFDVEELFSEFEQQQDEDTTGSTKPKDAGASTGPSTGAAPPSSGMDDIDDFFDSLLNDTLPTKSPATTNGTHSGGKAPSAASAKAPAVATAKPKGSADTVAAASAAAGGKDVSKNGGKTPTAAAEEAKAPEAEKKSEPSAGEAGRGAASPADAGAPAQAAAPAAKEENQEEAPPPPTSAEDALLRGILVQFYQDRKIDGKLRNVAVIAERYAGEKVPELWAQLALKYSVPPPVAVQWLAKSLGPSALALWPRGCVPEVVKEALVSSVETADTTPASAVLKKTLSQEGHIEAVQALTMRCSLEEQEMLQRSLIWQTLLEWPPPAASLTPAAGGAGAGGAAEEVVQEPPKVLAPAASDLEERRAAYRELATRMKTSTEADGSTGEGGSSSSTSSAANGADLSTLREEVEADAKAFIDADFFKKAPDMARAVTAIALTYAWRCRKYIRGSWDVAAVLLFVLVSGGAGGMTDIEADAFWCFSQLMVEVEDNISVDSCLVAQVHRVQALLKAYDPPLADLLDAHGLGALPALRLGAMLFTRAGFTLAQCARIWDILLADPRRFEFADYVIIALLLQRRGQLLEHGDVGGLAETLLEIPTQVDIDALLRTSYAICAFERRCSRNDPVPYPTRPAELGYGIGLERAREARDALAPAVEAAQAQLSSLWGRFRASGAEAWEAAPAAAQVRESMKQAAASAVSAAGTAATKASAALEEVQTAIAARVEEERERRKREEEAEAAAADAAAAEAPQLKPDAESSSADGAGGEAGTPAGGEGGGAPAASAAAAGEAADDEAPPQLVEMPAAS